MYLFREVINRFYFEKRIKFYSLIILSALAGFFEFMGLILIFQFVLFLTNPNSALCEKIVNLFNNNLNISDFSKISLILGITIAFVYILKNIYMLIFVRFNNKILQDLSTNITKKIMKNILFQDYLRVLKTSPEQKINVVAKISFVVWQYCYKYINLIINCAIAFILLGYLFFKFTIPAIVATIFISVLALIEYKILKKNSTYQNKHFSICFDELNSLLYKTICSIKEIKLNNKSQFFLDMIENKSKEYAQLNKNRSFCDIFHIYFTEISVMLAFIIVLIVLFFTTNFNNQILITTISTICIIILRLTPVINRAQSCLYSINSNKSVALELLEFDNQFDKNFNFASTNERIEFNESIEFRNVNFAYKNDSGLKDINLKINKGEFVGIVGVSGCYKTTLSLLISGLIKPKKGDILLDNSKLSDFDILKWQNNVALLSQDYSILFDELQNNEYLEKLNIKTNVNTQELSYGEKQRLALANILSQDKEILILDEVTSSSDVIVEDKISDILAQIKGEKTIIAIAHRLNILKYCDKIIYMKDGKIIDINTFKVLSEKYEEFKKIIELSSFKI